MKKISFMLLQIVIAAILIVMGILLSFKSTVNTQGSALVVMLVPGVDILLMPVFEMLKLKKWWMYSAVYFVIAALFGTLIALINRIPMDALSILAMIAVFAFTAMICTLFHLIYSGTKKRDTKKPGRTG